MVLVQGNREIIFFSLSKKTHIAITSPGSKLLLPFPFPITQPNLDPTQRHPRRRQRHLGDLIGARIEIVTKSSQCYTLLDLPSGPIPQYPSSHSQKQTRLARISAADPVPPPSTRSRISIRL